MKRFRKIGLLQVLQVHFSEFLETPYSLAPLGSTYASKGSCHGVAVTEGIRTGGFIPLSACDYPLHHLTVVPLPLLAKGGFPHRQIPIYHTVPPCHP